LIAGKVPADGERLEGARKSLRGSGHRVSRRFDGPLHSIATKCRGASKDQKGDREHKKGSSMDLAAPSRPRSEVMAMKTEVLANEFSAVVMV
jgi:hypothetical protein